MPFRYHWVIGPLVLYWMMGLSSAGEEMTSASWEIVRLQTEKLQHKYLVLALVVQQSQSRQGSTIPAQFLITNQFPAGVTTIMVNLVMAPHLQEVHQLR